MFSTKLSTVLAEYRKKRGLWTKIDPRALDTAIGFLNGLAMPIAPNAPLSKEQKAYAEAAKILRRCRDLIEVIVKYEAI